MIKINTTRSAITRHCSLNKIDTYFMASYLFRFRFCVLLCMLCMGTFRLDAVAQVSCTGDDIDRAETYYADGDFGEVIQTISACMPGHPARNQLSEERTPFNEALQEEGARLLALTYIALSDPDAAKTWVTVLVKLNPNVQALPSDSATFAKMVEDAKPRWHQKRWARLSGAALLVGGGALTYVLTRSNDLPAPPALPAPPSN